MGDFLSQSQIPESFIADNFLFIPLKPLHVDLDYEAVMSSKGFLRRWSQSQWPQDDFLVSDNLQDLEMHAREHYEKKAYTYTILNSKKDRCLGCIYIHPNTHIQPVTPEESQLLRSLPANVRFWVRESIQQTENEKVILESLIAWFHQDWKLDTILFTCNRQVPHQVRLFQVCGLRLWLELEQYSRYDLIWRSD